VCAKRTSATTVALLSLFNASKCQLEAYCVTVRAIVTSTATDAAVHSGLSYNSTELHVSVSSLAVTVFDVTNLVTETC
jgi:hypothetical protein